MPKFLFPDNIHTLTRAGAVHAVEKLSDTLHIPMSEAKVTRLDVSTVLIVNQSPCNYYPYLGQKPRFERLQATVDTLYYNTNKKQLIFYNKSAEAKAKGINIPVVYNGENLLRLEARFTQRLQKQFNLPEVTGATLTNERFYTGMIKRWGDEYFSINKIKSNLNMDTSKIKTPNDAKDALLSKFLLNAGSELIDSFIADLKAKNTYTDPKYYSRLKGDLKKLTTAKTREEQSDLINELDKAVREILLNCR